MKLSKEMKKAIILEHYKDPRHKHSTDDAAYLMHHQNSRSCIDDIQVQAKIEADVIADVCFDGKACSISTAATSMMCEMFCGMRVSEAEHFIEEYHNMLFDRPYDAELMEDFLVFDELHLQPNRIQCGLIGMKAMQQILEQYQSAQ